MRIFDSLAKSHPAERATAIWVTELESGFYPEKKQLLHSLNQLFRLQLSAYPTKWSYRPEPVSIKSAPCSCFELRRTELSAETEFR
jgi:hypothetical protein